MKSREKNKKVSKKVTLYTVYFKNGSTVLLSDKGDVLRSTVSFDKNGMFQW
jgi:hypothetical protein